MTDHMEPMSSVDTAWLRMEGETNLMMIGSVLILESRVDIDRFKAIVQERLLKFDRFRQKVSEEKGRWYWVDDPHFDIENHMHVVGLPGRGTKKDLQRLAADIDSTPLDFRKPLWQIHVVDRYQHGAALIFRIHHCIADGIALVRVMLSLTDSEPSPSPTAVDGGSEPPGHDNSITGAAAAFIRQSFHFGHEVLEEGIELLEHPQHLLDAAKKGVSIAAEVARIAALPSDPESCLKGPLSGRKMVAWAEPIELAQAKQAAKSLGVTLNDILLTAATGALRQYLLMHSSSKPSDQLHVAVPLNLRPLDKPITTLGNQFGLVIVKLPVGIADPQQRLEQVKQSMQALKKSYQAQVFYGMLSLFGMGPSALEQTALEVLSKKASLIMTNVPGPSRPLYIVGSRIVQPVVWVPQSGEVGLGLSIVSYAGTIQFGVVGDKSIVPDPDTLVRGFLSSLQELELLAKPEGHVVS